MPLGEEFYSSDPCTNVQTQLIVAPTCNCYRLENFCTDRKEEYKCYTTSRNEDGITHDCVYTIDSSLPEPVPAPVVEVKNERNARRHESMNSLVTKTRECVLKY